MGCRLVLGLALLGACRAELADGPVDSGMSRGDGMMMTSPDGATDGTPPLGAWGTPAKIPGASGAADEDDGTLSQNQLELYFKRVDAGDANLYMMTRASVTSPWSTPIPLDVLNTTGNDEESPRLSADDLTLYFGREGQVFRSTRAAVGGAWGAPAPVDTLNTGAYEKWAVACDGGYAMVSRSVTNRGQDLFEGTLAGGANTALVQLNSTGQEQGTYITTDCLRVYFQSNRAAGQFDIYMASRVTATAAWSNPTVLPDFNTTTSSEEDPWISADQRTFVFASDASGSKDLYMSTR